MLPDKLFFFNMRSYLTTILVFIWSVSLLFCTGCAKEAALTEFSRDDFIMDTIIHITVYTSEEKQGQQALEEAFGEFKRIHKLTDRFAALNSSNPEESDIFRINENAGEKPVQVSEDTFKMLERSLHFFNLTGGAFDPSIGPVVDLWGFGKKDYRVPGEDELANKISLVGMDQLIVDQENKTVFLPKKGGVLDLGGVAKGYATDLAVKKLREMGIKHAMINAGGNVYALGKKPDGTLWRVGIQDPREENQIVAVVNVADTALVSSGDYERYFVKENVRYHHIINPATGKPAEGLMETTVLAKSAADADILSTALFVLGEEKGKKMMKQLPEVMVVYVDTNRNVSFTQDLEGCLEFVEGGTYSIAGGF